MTSTDDRAGDGDQPGTSAGSSWLQAKPPEWWPRAVAVALVLVGVGLAAWRTFFALSQLWLMLLVAVFISFALEPAVATLSRRGMRRGTATVLVGGSVVAVLMVVFASIGAVLLRQGGELFDDLPKILADTVDWAAGVAGVDVSSARLTRPDGPIETLTSQISDRLSDGIIEVSAWALATAVKVLTVALFAFYMTADGPRIRRAIIRVFPPARQQHVLRVMELGVSKTGAFLWSRMILAGVSTAAHAVAFVAIGVPYPLPMALWVGVMSQAIPVFGTYLAAAAPMLVAAGVSSGTLLATLVAVVVYQQVENTLLAPRVTGSAVQVHPMLAFGSVIAGALLAGAVGATLAIPVAAMLQGFLSSVWQLHEVEAADHALLRDERVRKMRLRRRRPQDATDVGSPDVPG